MRKIFLSTVLAAMTLSAYEPVFAQNYTQTPVTVSKEKVRNSDGKYYYSHAVQERQTLFSIAKAYGVSVDEICDANKSMNLKTVGLKKNDIILIPIKSLDQVKQQVEKKSVETKQVETKQAEEKQVSDKKAAKQSKDDNYTVHVVKWFEDLDDIAAKYSISKAVLMQYNELKSEKLKNRQKLRIPSAAALRDMPQHVVSPVENTDTQKHTIVSQHNEIIDPNLEEADHSKVSAVLMLPFAASTSKPSESNMDFYSGVLLAVRHLAEQNIDTDLSVYDVAGGIQVTEDRLRHSDFAIGPISSQDMAKVLGIAPESTYIISPLDHKTASLVPSHRNLIQAPASQESQYLDLLKWIREERRSGDRIMVITEKGARATSGTALMDRLITESGLPYVTYSYNILQGRSAADAMTAHLTKSGTTRVIINSESEAFVNDVVRNLDMLVYRKNDVILYSSSKIRSFETIDVENLHNLKTRISTAYYIDYSSESVKRFLMEYRALYGTEPTQFAFQGYDLAYFFIKEKAAFGKRWVDDICRKGDTHMMQTDLMFKRTENGGIVNSAVRRIVYGPDYSISIIKR